MMMTSFAFIFGLLPRVIATGAGALSRRAVGTPVLGGMVFAALFGIFLIPMLYVIFQWLREWSRRKLKDAASPRRPGSPQAIDCYVSVLMCGGFRPSVTRPPLVTA